MIVEKGKRIIVAAMAPPKMTIEACSDTNIDDAAAVHHQEDEDAETEDEA